MKMILLILISLILKVAKTASSCNHSLGFSEGIIQDFQLSSSSVYVDELGHYPPWSILGHNVGHEGNYFAMQGPGWFQVDLMVPHKVVSIEAKVTHDYSISHSLDSSTWTEEAQEDIWTEQDMSSGRQNYTDYYYTYDISVSWLSPILSRYMRLNFDTIEKVEMYLLEMYGCTAGIEYGVEAGSSDVQMISVSTSGDLVETALEVPYIVTGVAVHSNDTEGPDIEAGDMLLYYHDELGNKKLLPITEVALSNDSVVAATLGFGVTAARFEVVCNITAYSTCNGIAIYGRKLSGCPPTFVEHNHRCYRSVHLNQTFQYDDGKSVCNRMHWQSQATLATSHDPSDIHFIDYFVKDPVNDSSDGIGIGLFFEEAKENVWAQGNASISDGIMYLWDDTEVQNNGSYCVTVQNTLHPQLCTEDVNKYMCEMPMIGHSNLYGHCDWFVQKGIAITHSSNNTVETTMLSECMRLCQDRNCSSLTYISHEAGSGACYLSSLHSHDPGLTLSDDPDAVTMDWICFQDINAACDDDLELCANIDDPIAECHIGNSATNHRYCRQACDTCDNGCARPMLYPSMDELSFKVVAVSHSESITELSENVFPYEWAPEASADGTLVRVEFVQLVKVTKMFLTCGLESSPCIVSNFSILLSNTSNLYSSHFDTTGEIKVFDGCSTDRDTNLILIDPSLVAKNIMILPLSPEQSNPSACMQFELFGCYLNASLEVLPEYGTYNALGMESGSIKDYQLTADYGSNGGVLLGHPWEARMGKNITLDPGALEQPFFVMSGEWIQLDLITKHFVSHIAFNNGGGTDHYLRQLMIKTSTATITDLTYVMDPLDEHEIKLFDVQQRSNVPAIISINKDARIVRIYPQSWSGSYVSFLMEIYGQPIITACPAIEVSMTTIQDPVPDTRCTNCTLSSPTEYTMCVSSRETILFLVLKRLHFLHGVSVKYSSSADDTSLAVEYANEFGSLSPSLREYPVSEEVDAVRINTVHYSGQFMTQVSHVELKITSVVQQCARVNIHACISNECPPGFVQMFTKCYGYVKDAITTRVSSENLCTNHEWGGRTGALAKIDNEHILSFMRDFIVSSILPKLYIDGEFTSGDPIDSALVGTAVRNNGDCLAVTTSGLEQAHCTEENNFLCEINATQSIYFVQRRWISYSNMTVSGGTAVQTQSVVECLQLCAEAVIQPECVAISYDTLTDVCSLQNFYAIDQSNTTQDGHYYFELVKEQDINVSSLLFDMPGTLPIPFIPHYDITSQVSFTITNIDNQDIRRVREGINFVATFYLANEDLSGSTHVSDDSILHSETLDLTEIDEKQGIASGNHVVISTNINLNLDDRSCSATSHMCIEVKDGSDGYFLRNLTSPYRIVCLPVDDSLMNCGGTYNALGMESGSIKDYQLTADYGSNGGVLLGHPWEARMGNNITLVPGALEQSFFVMSGEWLQVDLLTKHFVSHMAFNNGGGTDHYVRQLMIKTSTATIRDLTYVMDPLDEHEIKLFDVQQRSNVPAVISTNKEARIVRIYPQSWSITYVSFLMEIYGQPIISACPVIEVSLATIQDPVPDTRCTNCTQSSPTEYTMCVSSIDTVLYLVLKRLYFLHGVSVKYSSSADDTSLAVEYANEFGSLSPSLREYPVSEVVDAIRINTVHYSGQFMTQVSHVELKITSVVQQCARVNIHACISNECPPGFVQMFTKCYGYVKDAITTRVSSENLCTNHEWGGRAGALAKIDNDHILSFMRDFIVSSIHPKLYIDGGDPIGSALVGAVVRNNGDCLAVTISGLEQAHCTEENNFLCEINATQSIYFEQRRWISYSNMTVSGGTAVQTQSVVECLQLCTEAVIQPECVAISYDTLTDVCSLQNFYAIDQSNTTQDGHYYFELVKEQDINVSSLLFGMPGTLPLPFIPHYDITSQVSFTITNIDNQDIRRVREGINFVATFYLANEDLSGSTHVSDDSILHSETLDLTEIDEKQGIASGNHVVISTNINLNLDDRSCSATSHMCIEVKDGSDGYFLRNLTSPYRIVCLPVDDSLMNCGGTYNALGMESRSIKDYQLTADYGSNGGVLLGHPWEARMGNNITLDPGALEQSFFVMSGEWLQVDLLTKHFVSHMAFNNGGGTDHYVRQLMIKTSTATIRDLTYVMDPLDEHEIKLFDVQQRSNVPAVISTNKEARIVRIYPQSWSGSYVSFLMEIYGQPINTACPAIDVSLATIQDPVPYWSCSNCAQSSPIEYTMCVSRRETILSLVLKRLHFLHGVSVRYSSSADDTSLAVEYANECGSTSPNLREYPVSEVVDAVLINTVHYSGQFMTQVSHVELKITSVVQQCARVNIHACISNECPPGFVQMFTKCYGYVKDAITTRVSSENLCTNHEWGDRTGALAKIDNDHILSFMRDFIVSSIHPKLYIDGDFTRGDPIGSALIGAVVRNNGDCLAVTTSGIEQVHCTEENNFLCEINATQSIYFEQRRWISYSNMAASGGTAVQTQSVVECLQLCTEAVIQPDCDAISYDTLTNACSLQNFYAIDQSNTTQQQDGHHHFELVKEQDISVSSLRFDMPGTPPIPFIPHYDITAEVSFNITNIDNQDIRRTREGINFVATFYLANEDLSGSPHVSNDSILHSETLDLTEGDEKQGIASANHLVISANINLNLDDQSCSATSHMCIEVEDGLEGYFLKNLTSPYRIVCLPVDESLMNCGGLPILGLILDSTVAMDGAAEVDIDTVTFTFSWELASEMTCVLDLGDSSHNVTWTQDPASLDFIGGSHSETYIYNYPGNFTVTLTCSNDQSTEIRERLVAVEVNLDTMINISAHYIPAPVLMNVVYNLNQTHNYNYTANVYMRCNFDLQSDGPTNDDLIEEFWLTSDGTMQIIPYANDVLHGYVNTSINCSNHVSYKDDIMFEIVLREDITGATFTAIANAFETGTPAIFEVTIDTGSHVEMQVDFGDGANETLSLFNLTNLSPRFWQILHIYDNPGNYTLNVISVLNVIYELATNLVIHDLTIQNAIVNLTFTDTPRFILSPPAQITFNLIEGEEQGTLSNIHCFWSITPGYENSYTYIDSFDFSFGTPHTFRSFTRDSDTPSVLTGTCNNMITTGYTLSYNFDIFLDDIEVISVTNPGPDWWRNTTYVTLVHGIIYTDFDFKFDMDDGNECILSNPGQVSNTHECVFTVNVAANYTSIELAYVYETWGFYDIGYLAFKDHWGSYDFRYVAFNRHWQYAVRGNVIVSVLEWTCFPPSLLLPEDVSENSTREIFRSHSDSIAVEVTSINCMKTDEMAYLWEAVDSEGTLWDITDLAYTNSTIFIPIRYFPYGNYILYITITMVVNETIFGVNPPVKKTIEASIALVHSPIIAILQDAGEELLVYHNQILRIDGSGSYDPDLDPPWTPDGIEFQWSCRRQETNDSVNVHNPATWVGEMCGTEFVVQSFNLPMLIFDIQAAVDRAEDSLKAEYDYNIQMLVSKPGHPPSEPVMRSVKVLTSSAPVIHIECESGCNHDDEKYVSIAYRKLFNYTCIANCVTTFGGTKQRWSLYMLDESGRLQNGSVDLFTTPEFYVSIPEQQRYTIGPGVLEGDRKYVIKVQAWTPGSYIGHAELEFWVATPPFNGTCSVTPDQGLVFEQIFEITCTNWKVWQLPGQNSRNIYLEYGYYFAANDSDMEQLLYDGTNSSYSAQFLPVGYIQFYVEIRDSSRAITKCGDGMVVQVYQPSFEGDTAIDDEEEYYANLANTVNVEEGAENATAKINSLISLLDSPPVHDEHQDSRHRASEDSNRPSQDERATMLRQSLAQRLSELPVELESIELITQTITNLVTSPNQTSSQLVNLTSTGNLGAVNTLVRNMRINIDQRNNLASGILSSISSMLEASTLIVEKDTGNDNTDNTTRGPEEIITSMYSLNAAIDRMLDGFVDAMLFNEFELISSAAMTMQIQKVNSSRVVGKNHTLGGAKFTMSPDSDPGEECLTYKATISKSNPKLYGAGSEQVNSEVLTLNMEPCDSVASKRKKRQIETSNLEVTLPVADAGLHSVFDLPESHNLTLSNPLKEVIVSIYPKDLLFLDVYIKFNDAPTLDYYDEFYTFPLPLENLTIPYGATDEDIFDLQRTVFFTKEQLEYMNATEIRIAIAMNRYEYYCPNCTSQDEPMYQYGLSEAGCRQWDDVEQIWFTGNCFVQYGTTAKQIKFKSDLLGSIGGGVFAGPNYIDLSGLADDLGERLLGAVAVISTMTGLIVIFIPLCILCRRLDQKDKVKWSILPLLDNAEDDGFSYEVHVYTGLKRNSGTKSNVSIIIAGTESDTGIRPLTDGVRQNFTQSDVNSFLMTTPDSLGIPVTLKIWHDNSGEGKHASWFLSKIVVVDLQTSKWYVFLCDSWLAVDQGDCLVERFLHVALEEEIAASSRLLQHNLKRKLFDDHIWLSIGYRSTKSTFSRVQRLCCCLTLLFLGMIANAMWYRGGDVSEESKTTGNQVAFVIGPIDISVQQVYASFMSCVIVFPVIVIITVLFAKAKRKQNDHTVYILKAQAAAERNELSDKRKSLPHFFIYIAYVIIVLCVMVSAFFTILYAMEWGKTKANAWLLAFFLSFAESVILLQPFKAVLLAVVLSLIFKKDTDITEFEKNFGQMEERNDLIKAVSKNLEGAAKIQLSQEEQAEIRKRANLDKKFKEMVKEAFWQITLLCLMCWVVTGNQNANVYLQNQHLTNVFMFGFPKNGSIDGVFKWLNDTVIRNMYNTLDYNENAYTDEKRYRYLSDGYGFRLGPPRLRQLRVPPDLCKRNEWIHHIVHHCSKSYHIATQDQSDYLLNWEFPVPTDYNRSALSDPQRAFLYTSRQQLNGLSYWGRRTIYSGGGYVANLGNRKEGAVSLLNELHWTNWIDRYSRALMVEFNVWNVNTNLFNYVMILVEFPSEGAFVHTVNIETLFLYRYVGAGGVLAIVSELILVLSFISLTVKEIIHMIKLQRKYLASFWNWVRILSIILFFVALGLYAYRSVLTVSTVEEMMNNRDKTISFHETANINRIYIIVLGFSAFCVQIGLLNILRYNKNIALMAATLQASTKDLLNVLVFLIVFIIAFASFMTQHFGAVIGDYRNFPSALTTLISGFMGKFDFNSVINARGAYGAVMLLLYLLLMLYFALNVFISVLTDYMAELQGDPESLDPDHEVIDYMFSILKSAIGLGERQTLVAAKQKRLMKQREQKNKRKQATKDADHLLHRVQAIESFTSMMESSALTQAMEELLDNFVQNLSKGQQNEQKNDAVETDNFQAAPLNVDGSTAKNLIVETALLKVAERSIADGDNIHETDSGINSPNLSDRSISNINFV